MPNTRSSKKRVRQNEKRRLRNRTLRSELRTGLRKFREVESADEKQTRLAASFSALDRAVSKGIIHPNQANRKKRRLSLQANKGRDA